MNEKSVLLHVCCAPCSLYCIKVLQELGQDVHLFWYNPNIHPYTEYVKRFDEVKKLAETSMLPLLAHDEYALEEFLRKAAFHEDERCISCYLMRLDETARMAAQLEIPAFTTSLLYSKFQKHELIRATGEEAARKYGVKFLYHDFREGWRYGVDTSKEMGMYRQQYCGCIYSEKDRYLPRKQK